VVSKGEADEDGEKDIEDFESGNDDDEDKVEDHADRNAHRCLLDPQQPCRTRNTGHGHEESRVTSLYYL